MSCCRRSRLEGADRESVDFRRWGEPRARCGPWFIRSRPNFWRSPAPLAFGPKPIAKPWHGDNESRRLDIRLKALTQAPDGGSKQRMFGDVFLAPHLLQQLRRGDHMPGFACQCGEDPELGPREMHQFTALEDAALRGIDEQAIELHGLYEIRGGRL